jgi:1-acyl-sn-glycerol-3-phosphate acyltransferase
MDVLTILIVIVIVGVLLWLVNSYVPMDGKIKKILNIVVVILLVIWLLSAFGAFHYLGGVHINTR